MFGLIVETVGYSSNYFNLSVFVENVSIEGYFFKRPTIQGMVSSKLITATVNSATLIKKRVS